MPRKKEEEAAVAKKRGPNSVRRGGAARTSPKGSTRVKKAVEFRAISGTRGTRLTYHIGSYATEAADSRGAEPASLREMIERSLESRATAGFRESLGRMTLEQLQRAVAAPTAAGTVVEVLSAAPDVGLPTETAMTRALARGAVAKQEMLQEAGGCLSSGEVARLLGITVSGVNLRRARNAILAVPLSGGEWGFPARQFEGGELRAGVAEVVRRAASLDRWVLLSILLDPVPAMGGEVIIDHLDQPEVRGDVFARIDSYGEHVAS